jgi:hypothetical protein
MKKTLLLSSFVIVLLSISSITYAQFQKGQLLLNGNFSFAATNDAYSDTISNSNTSKPITFNFSPSISKFISSNTAYGIGLNYSLFTTKNINQPANFGQNINMQTIGLKFYRIHYLILSKNFYFSYEVGLDPSYTFSNTNNMDSSSIASTDKINRYSIAGYISTGVSYRVNNRLLINASLPNLLSIGYSHSTETNTSGNNFKQTSNEFEMSSGLGSSTLGDISIGFSYLIH